MHGSDVNSKYRLLEHAAPPALSAEQQPAERNKKKYCPTAHLVSHRGGSSSAAAVPNLTLHRLEATGAPDIRRVTRTEAKIYSGHSGRFDDRNKIELLHKARNEAISDITVPEP